MFAKSLWLITGEFSPCFFRFNLSCTSHLDALYSFWVSVISHSFILDKLVRKEEETSSKAGILSPNGTEVLRTRIPYLRNLALYK